MSYQYAGTELGLFATAINWKGYIAQRLGRLVGGRVLEVGAGIGGNTGFLYNSRVCEWTCLEPDPDLARRIKERLTTGGLPPGCRVVAGTIAAIATTHQFDTILYLDVLEHIAADADELARAGSLLSPEGCLVVLAPAHPFLFSPFDASIGHYRRYNRATLRGLTPANCRFAGSMMLDSAGFFASLANRLLLAKTMPSKRQIAIWDKIMVPASRHIDRLTRYKFGKSVVGVWRRTA